MISELQYHVWKKKIGSETRYFAEAIESQRDSYQLPMVSDTHEGLAERLNGVNIPEVQRVSIIDDRPEHLRNNSSAVSLDQDELTDIRTKLGLEK